jgi:hypothetical protein
MGIFDKKTFTKYELRRALKTPSFRSFSGDKKTQLEEDLFIKKHGGSVSKSELDSRIDSLIKERQREKNYGEKAKINERISSIKKMKKSANEFLYFNRAIN